jgi:hypothetical protein
MALWLLGYKYRNPIALAVTLGLLSGRILIFKTYHWRRQVRIDDRRESLMAIAAICSIADNVFVV